MYNCKICLEKINDLNDVYSPCNCRGSLNYIHKNCFEEAYIKNNIFKCEICNINFPIIKKYYLSIYTTDYSNFNTDYNLTTINNYYDEDGFIDRNYGNFPYYFIISNYNIIKKLLIYIIKIFYYVLLFSFMAYLTKKLIILPFF